MSRNSLISYLIKRKDCILYFFNRFKIQLLQVMTDRFMSGERLCNMPERAKMLENEDEDTRVEPQMEKVEVDPLMLNGVENEAYEESWDVDFTSDIFGNVPENVNAFHLDTIKNELDEPNTEAFSVQPTDEETDLKWTTVTELFDRDLLADGVLRFTFTIHNFTSFWNRARKIRSDTFRCRDIPFHLCVQKNLDPVALSAFLVREKTGNEDIDTGLDVTITCDLSAVDQLNGNLITKSFYHTFRVLDWGFSSFITVNDTLNSGVLHNDSLIIRVNVKAEPPVCSSHLSKKLTGFVGIRNQGATCYMNSLLQVLFFLTKFRTACYRIPTEMDDELSVALALQKVFYNLEFSETAVCTENLTNSFGWSSVDVLTQHDIQEMMRMLIDKVEDRMKNTLLEPILPSIFQGKFVSYVKCRDIEFSSQREEVFYDIQLSLENSENLYESFKHYVAPEMMDDDNKYHAGDHGLQAAQKGTLFISLPPIMFLHLLRFQYDAAANQVMKNDKFFEFYEQIDLTEFVRDDDSTLCKYTLFAVLSHRGGGSHGHYVAYINPSVRGTWLKFDDDRISVVQPSDAINSNFGISNEANDWAKTMQFNAYMLVYVRNSMVDDIFEPTDPKYITDELKLAATIDPDELSKNELKGRFTTDVYVLLSTLLESECLPSFQEETQSKMPKFAVTSEMTTFDLKQKLKVAFKLSSINEIRIWHIAHAPRNLAYPLYINEDDNFLDASPCGRMRYSPCVKVWLEMALPGTELPPFDPQEDVLVFYYYYSGVDSRKFYIHHGYHKKSSTIGELVPVLNSLMEWPIDRKLNVYQILSKCDLGELSDSTRLSDCKQFDINTFVMHVVFEPKEHDQSTTLNSVALYYQDLKHRRVLTITNDDPPRADEILCISTLLTFQDLVNMLADQLHCERNKLQIFHSKNGCMGEAIPSTTTGALTDIFNFQHPKTQLFYKLHRVNVIDVETKHNFTFIWLPIDIRQKSEKHTLYLSNDETMTSIMDEAKNLINQNQPNGSGHYRLLWVVANEKLKILKDSTDIYQHIDEMKHSAKSNHFRIEEIPSGEEFCDKNERYVLVNENHAFMQHSLPPIIYKIKMNESWECVKEHIRVRLHLSEANWTEYRPLVILSQSEEKVDVDDSKCLNEYDELMDNFYISLRHKNKMYKRYTGKINQSSNIPIIL